MKKLKPPQIITVGNATRLRAGDIMVLLGKPIAIKARISPHVYELRCLTVWEKLRYAMRSVWWSLYNQFERALDWLKGNFE